MEEDQIQLCLRLYAVIKDFTSFAHIQHQKIKGVEASIESTFFYSQFPKNHFLILGLFYYYEAFLSATKNICKIFPELEKLLINTYKLGWLDLNTSIFMYYFYETPYVQDIIQEFELVSTHVQCKSNL